MWFGAVPDRVSINQSTVTSVVLSSTLTFCAFPMVRASAVGLIVVYLRPGDLTKKQKKMVEIKRRHEHEP